ncbi:retrovirus-related pol polyprotein from transposon TNT 1-94 [Tanacetum coccineum]|uniref:Retrovirus-related pol polyprotein from transposon TNT 1-94 n=1 Tax=Tanacetum coccineum TaxID=301880 RepID=A0ABQ5G663_9ASTR
MTSGQISSGLDLTYALPTITTQKPTECELDLLFEAMYDDYIGGQPSSATITASAVPTIQVLHTPTASSTTADTAPKNLSSQATNIPNTSQDVDELEPQQQHEQIFKKKAKNDQTKHGMEKTKSIPLISSGNLEVAFRRNTCFVKNLEGVDLLKGNRTTNLYTINLHEMVSVSPICFIARATSTKSWLWHQRLSHLNFNTINDLAKNDLVTGLPKFKYHKEHLCPSCEQGKSKKASHPPKHVPNSKQRLHLLHLYLCGPMRVESINGKRYVLVIVDDYSRYTWVHFLRSKDEAPEEIKTFLKKITVLEQALVIIVRIDNDTTFKNQVL